MPKKRLLILLTNPFAVLNMLHSGLVSALSLQYEVTIWSDKPLPDPPGEAKYILLSGAENPFPKENRAVWLLRTIQKSLFFSYFAIQTEAIRCNNKHHFGRNLASGIATLLVKAKLAGHILRFLRSSIRFATSNTRLAETMIFDGVISTSPLDVRENRVINGVGKPVRTLAMVISWDNLTSKGVINADHDAILVWNRYMEQEVQQQYRIYQQPLPSIFITGNPRFDRYFEPSEVRSSSNVLFATSAQIHFPEQTTIAAHLSEYASTRPHVSVTIRCHIFDDPAAYADLQSPKIRVEPAAVYNDIPFPNYLETLHKDLLTCHICVQVASTIRIDAAACNRHVVSIAYDGGATKVYHQSVRRFYDYTHQLPLNTLELDHRVYSKTQLFETLDNLLKIPTSEVSLRSQIRSFTHFDTPSAIDATLSAVEKWLA